MIKCVQTPTDQYQKPWESFQKSPKIISVLQMVHFGLDWECCFCDTLMQISRDENKLIWDFFAILNELH